MAAPGTVLNWSQIRGTDRQYQDTILGSDGVTPLNITGWAFAFTLFAYGNPSNVFLTKTTLAGTLTLSDPVNGVLTFTIAAADTLALRPGTYEFKIERTDAGADDVPTRGLWTLI